MVGTDRPNEVESVHFRHIPVNQRQVDLSDAFKPLQRFPAIGRFDDFKIQPPEHPAQDAPHGF
jgi:hypothetical protein